MNDKIITYIKSEISMEPLDDIHLEEDLLGNGIVDSLGMMKLVVFLEKEFKVKIAVSYTHLTLPTIYSV